MCKITKHDCKKQKPTENDGGWAKPTQKYWQSYAGKNIQKKKVLANHRHGRKMQQKIQDFLIYSVGYSNVQQ